MTRYLTPHRIGILVLVQEYFQGQLPLTSRMQVLRFIAKHSDIKDEQDGSSGHEVLSRIDASIVDLFTPLTTLASSVPGRSVYDILLQGLWSLQSLHALHEFFEKVAQHVDGVAKAVTVPKDSIVPSRASPLGQYCRRCWLEFTRLEFDDTRSLWLAYKDWRAPTFNHWSQRNPENAAHYGASDDINDLDPVESFIEGPSQSVVSAADVNSVITSSIYYLQKLGTRAPDAMKDRLRSWLTDQHDAGVQSLQHFMQFFDHWKAGQYTMALESLHRYFDYSLVAKSGSNDNMRVYYQYALLHLSVLHADFDCWEESVDAMNECIATARENHDTVCLNFALSWLLYLRQAKPDTGRLDYRSASGFLGAAAGEQDEIGFLKAKAKDTKHWSLLSSTLLEEAKLGMHLNGVTSTSFEHIVQAAYVNMQHDLQTLMPAATLFESAALERLGQSHVSGLAHDVVRSIHADQAPLADRVRSVCRSAYNAAQAGQYAPAMEMLEGLLPVVGGVLKLEQRILGFMTLVQLVKSLAMAKLDHARYHLAQLKPLQSLGDTEVDFELNLVAIELAIQESDLEQAMAMVNVQLQRSKNTTSHVDISHRLHYMVLKSRIFALAGQASQGFSVASRAASTAMRLKLVPTLLEAALNLTTILNELAEFDAVIEMLEAILPKVNECRSSRLLPRALVTLAEAHVGLAGVASDAERNRLVREADDLFERAREAYSHLSDHNGMLDCLAMKSLLAKWKGDEHAVAQSDGLYAQLVMERQVADLSM